MTCKKYNDNWVFADLFVERKKNVTKKYLKILITLSHFNSFREIIERVFN